MSRWCGKETSAIPVTQGDRDTTTAMNSPFQHRKEGDLIIGTNRSAIGTLVERKSRSTLLVHLPRLAGYGEQPVVKNGPALSGYGAEAMAAALTVSMTQLPQQLSPDSPMIGPEMSR